MIASETDLFSVNHACNAMGHNILHLRMLFFMRKSLPCCLLYYGIGDGMRIMFLKAGCKPKHFLRIISAKCNDARNLRRRLGERSRFIEYDCLRIRKTLHHLSAFDGNVVHVRFPHGRQDRYRHGELQRTAEINHQDGICLRRVPGQKICEAGKCKSQRDQTVCQIRCFRLRIRFQFLRILNHGNDLVILTGALVFCDAHSHLALFHDSSRENSSAFLLVYGKRLPGDRRLIYHPVSGFHNPVERDHVAGPDDNPVAFPHLVHIR